MSAPSRTAAARFFAFYFTRRRFPLLLRVSLAAIAVFGLSTLLPLLSQELIDEVVAIKDVPSLVSYGIGMLLLAIAIGGFSYYQGLLLSAFSYLFDYDYSSLVYKHVLHQSAARWRDKRVGEVFARLEALAHIREFFSGATGQVLISAVTAITYTCILFAYSAKVAAVPLVALLLIGSSQFLFRGYLRRKNLEDFELQKQNQSQLTEMIHSIATLKAFRAERSMLGHYEKSFLETVKNRRDISVRQAALNSFLTFASTATRLVGIAVATTLFFKRELTVGEIFSVNLFISRILGPLNQLVDFAAKIQDVSISMGKVNDVLSEGADSLVERRKGMGVRLRGRISLDRVRYRYDEQSPWALQDISLTIFPRQVVALVGESGCGKTTLANLLAGVLLPTSGRILYDGFDGAYISRQVLQSQVGFIQQASELFSGTIESNVAWGYTFTNERRLNASLTDAHALEFVSRFPTGAAQYLAEGGLGLSGGQKQRLAIARTLYAEPALLILDEATSALDGETEAVLVDNLKKLARDKTTIIIAHRLSTIRHADVVHVMEHGRIVETGTHDSLVRQRGKYTELFREQMR